MGLKAKKLPVYNSCSQITIAVIVSQDQMALHIRMRKRIVVGHGREDQNAGGSHCICVTVYLVVEKYVHMRLKSIPWRAALGADSSFTSGSNSRRRAPFE